MRRDFNRQRVITIITVMIVGLWIAATITRVFRPWPEAAILDAAMPSVIGYWFAASAITKNGQAGVDPGS